MLFNFRQLLDVLPKTKLYGQLECLQQNQIVGFLVVPDNSQLVRYEIQHEKEFMVRFVQDWDQFAFVGQLRPTIQKIQLTPKVRLEIYVGTLNEIQDRSLEAVHAGFPQNVTQDFQWKFLSEVNNIFFHSVFHTISQQIQILSVEIFLRFFQLINFDQFAMPSLKYSEHDFALFLKPTLQLRWHLETRSVDYHWLCHIVIFWNVGFLDVEEILEYYWLIPDIRLFECACECSQYSHVLDVVTVFQHNKILKEFLNPVCLDLLLNHVFRLVIVLTQKFCKELLTV